LFVPPRWAGVLVAHLDDVPQQFRRSGLAMPTELAAWLLDLKDLAESTPLPAPVPESAVWLDVATAADAFAAGGVPLSTRWISGMARRGLLRSRRDGHRWLVAADDVDAEIEARQQTPGSHRNRPGIRDGRDPSSSAA
jgi:hypothetical protein